MPALDDLNIDVTVFRNVVDVEVWKVCRRGIPQSGYVLLDLDHGIGHVEIPIDFFNRTAGLKDDPVPGQRFKLAICENREP